MMKTLFLMCVMALAGTTLAYADEGTQRYTFTVVSQQVTSSPLEIVNSNGHVSDSDVGNQNYYVSTCYTAKNITDKTIVLERYKVVFYTALDGMVGTKYPEVRHNIQPQSLDQPFINSILPEPMRSQSECFQFINLWGDGLSKAKFSVDAVQFSDGTVWKASDMAPKKKKKVLPRPHVRPTP